MNLPYPDDLREVDGVDGTDDPYDGDLWWDGSDDDYEWTPDH
ncbi:hypothetical protein [Streptomyces sp. 5-10]|nr:hypothetical protein [Streptomyces sp. 5-10]